VPHSRRDRPLRIAILKVDELAPIEMRLLEQSSLFAPLRMVIPEFLADVGELEPRIDQDTLTVRGGNHGAKVGIARLIAVEEFPRGDMQRGYSGFSPSRREVIEIDATPVRRVEESPQAIRTERRLEPQIHQAVQQVRQTLVAPFPWRDRDPQTRPPATPES